MAYSKPIHAAVLTFSCGVEGHVGMKIEKNQIARQNKNKALSYEVIETISKRFSLVNPPPEN